MTATATIPAYAQPPLVVDADVADRFAAGMAHVSKTQPDLPELIGVVDELAWEIEGNMKASARCGGKMLPSHFRRIVCLKAILRELEATQTGGRK